MKTAKLLIASTLFTTLLPATLVFEDTFSSGTPADAGYYRFGTTNTTLGVADGTLNYSYASGATNRSGVMKQFANTSLDVGEILLFSFTVDSRDLRDDENNSFRWSIGNISTTVDDDFSSAEPFSGGTRRNYVFAAATGVASTALNQHAAGFSSPVNGGTNTAISGLDASNFANSSDDPFDVVMSFTRTATGLDIVKNFGGTISSGSFATTNANDFIFNTLAFSFKNAGDYSVSLDNISVSVIPEPSTLVLLGVALICGLVFRRAKA